ncbi:MAG: hypothetical protein ABIL46_02950 [candidate division WOR-3 bacterium]
MLKAEIFRKLLNLWAIFIPVLYYLLPQTSARSLLLLVTVIVTAIDFIRLHVNGVKEGFILFFGSFLRRHELTNLSGATFLLLGCLITALLFPRFIVISSTSFIIVGDTFAAIFGQNIKGPKLFKKTLIGSLAYLGSNIVVVVILYSLLNIPFWILFAGALISTIFEALPLPWDDNFSVPIITGIGMNLIM